MSEDILADLDFPAPDRFLGVGWGSHGAQTARVLETFAAVLAEEQPALVVVAGDVNSTLACALAAAKRQIPVAHVESGLRSLDWSMPEEINRVLTDRLSDILFTHSPEALDHLVGEGIDAERVHFVGNTMIDSLARCEGRARSRAVWTTVGFEEGDYVLVTLHRPSNVDDPARLALIVDGLVGLAARHPTIFPVHPRTRARLAEHGLLARLEDAGVVCSEPLGYLDFLSLQAGAGAIVTDSGGVQEEASALSVPCYTFRPNTERPVTLLHGTNLLLGDDPADLASVEIPPRDPKGPSIPLWDGRASERIADVLVARFGVPAAAAAVEEPAA
jgi:UDP-N-acetylglucosamine 2-epimerase (non-hydrolysing)